MYNFGRSFLGHHYYILNLTEPCPSEDKKRRNIALSLTCHAPAKKKHVPGVMKFTILVDFSMAIITIHLVCLTYTWVKRRTFLKK